MKGEERERGRGRQRQRQRGEWIRNCNGTHTGVVDLLLPFFTLLPLPTSSLFWEISVSPGLPPFPPPPPPPPLNSSMGFSGILFVLVRSISGLGFFRLTSGWLSNWRMLGRDAWNPAFGRNWGKGRGVEGGGGRWSPSCFVSRFRFAVLLPLPISSL